jgi:hypothetical protein
MLEANKHSTQEIGELRASKINACAAVESLQRDLESLKALYAADMQSAHV